MARIDRWPIAVGFACTLAAWVWSAHSRADVLIPVAGHAIAAGERIAQTDILFRAVPQSVAEKDLAAPYIGRQAKADITASQPLLFTETSTPKSHTIGPPSFDVAISAASIPTVRVGDDIWLFAVGSSSAPVLIVRSAPVVSLLQGSTLEAVLAVPLNAAEAILDVQAMGRLVAVIGPPESS